MEHIESKTLWQYVAGDTSRTESIQIKNHLSSCEDCMKEIELINQIEATLEVVDKDRVSLGFSDAVIRKIEIETELERNSIFNPKFLPYAILGGFALAILSAIIAGAGLDLNLSQVESTLNIEFGILILTSCGILWGLYFIDRICKKIFVGFDHA